VYVEGNTERKEERIKKHINLSQASNKEAYAGSQHTPEAFDLYIKGKSAQKMSLSRPLVT
jgi:hypothetical protein